MGTTQVGWHRGNLIGLCEGGASKSHRVCSKWHVSLTAPALDAREAWGSRGAWEGADWKCCGPAQANGGETVSFHWRDNTGPSQAMGMAKKRKRDQTKPPKDNRGKAALASPHGC